MDMQNVSNLQIPEGEVRTIHDKDNRLIWGRLAYDTKYVGNSEQRNLPKGYTQVLGIRAGNAASYIDIATTIGTDDSFEYSYSISIAKTPVHWGYRGAVTYDSANSFNGTFTGEGRLVVFANSSSANTNTQTTELLDIDTRLDFKYDGDTKTASILGYTFTKSSGFAPDIEPPQNHFVLNGAYITRTNSYMPSTAGNIIYRFKSAECDIYPCVRDSDGKVGLYDVKRNIFIPPTAGTFTVVTGDVVPTPDTPIPVQVVTGEQNVKVTGKNLLNASADTGSLNGVNYTKNGDGTYTVNGTANGTSSFVVGSIELTANTQYVVSGCPGTGSGSSYNVRIRDANYTALGFDVGNGATITPTETKTYYYQITVVSRQSVSNLVFKPMICLSTTSNPDYSSYEPYQGQSYTVDLGSIGLAKIGNYQDYIYKSGDDWYVHKAINKVILDGSEVWSMYSGRNGTFYMTKSDIMPAPSISATPDVISDYYEPKPFASLYNMIVDYGVANHNAQRWIAVRNKDYSDVSSFKTWLASNNTTVYYVLATPTDTQITDATLISQLNAVHEWLTRYGYNATIAGDLPIVLQRDSLQ